MHKFSGDLRKGEENKAIVVVEEREVPAPSAPAIAVVVNRLHRIPRKRVGSGECRRRKDVCKAWGVDFADVPTMPGMLAGNHGQGVFCT